MVSNTETSAQRWSSGCSLNDEEMLSLLVVYDRVARDTIQLGPSFRKAYMEAAKQAAMLKHYARQRGLLSAPVA